MLNKCAKAFRRLLDYEVEITFHTTDGCNTICIDFCESDFFHLAGLHKLIDITFPNSKASVLNLLANKPNYCNKLEKSVHYNKIKLRVELLNSLSYILKSPIQVYPFKENNAKWSKIRADYVIKFFFESKQSILFLRKRKNNYYVCNSIIQNNSNYVRGIKKLKITNIKIRKKPDKHQT